MADRSMKINEVPDDLTVEQAQELFGTEIDRVIEAMLQSLAHYGFTDADFELLLEAMKELMEATMETPPSGMTVEEGMPYVYVSDLLTLGALTCEIYKHQVTGAKHG
jgi:hypothetical protein